MASFVTKHLKAKKIAWISHGDAYGSWNVEAGEYQLKKENPEAILNVERIERDMTDAMPVALKVKNANPDVICIMTYDRPAVLILKALHDLGVRNTIALSCNGFSNFALTLKGVGVKEAFANLYIQETLAYHPGQVGPDWGRKLYRDYYPDLAKLPEYPSSYFFIELASTMVVTKALQDAGPDLTREKLIAALENIRNFDTNGVMAGPYTFGPDKHAAQDILNFLKIEDPDVKVGTWKPIPVPGVFESIWKPGAQK